MKLPIAMLALAVGLFWLLPQPYVSSDPPTRDVNVVNVPGVEIVNDAPIEVTAAIDAPIAVTPNVVERFYEFDADFLQQGTSGVAFNLLTVPAGKRAVVQYVSARVWTDRSSTSSCKLQRSNSFDTVVHLDSTEKRRADDEIHTVSTPITFFADAGQIIQLDCSVSPEQTENHSAGATVTGYFEDVE